MGFIKERMTAIFLQRIIRPFGFSASAEIMPYVVAIDLTGTDTTVSYAVKAKVRVIDAWALATVDNGSGTVTLKDNDGNAITNALTFASSSTIARATSIDVTDWTEIKGNNLQATKNNVADKGWLFVVVVPMNA